MQENATNNVGIKDKKKKLFTLVFLVIFLLTIALLGYWYYANYVKKSHVVNNVPNNSQHGESVFGKLVEGDLNSEDFSHTGQGRYDNYTDSMGGPVKATISAMTVGSSVFKSSEDDIISHLPSNCVAVKFVKDGDGNDTFVLLGSTVEGYTHNIGDKVDVFNYDISSGNIVVLDADGVYKVLDDFSNFHNRLKKDSRLVFSCANPSCDDNKISWILVLSEDLDI
jgi:competence protein ComGC